MTRPTALGTLPELLIRLDTTPAGLSSAQAARRVPPGHAPRHRGAALFAALRGVVNPLIAILAIAGVASAFVGEPVQAAIIGAMIALGIAIDLWQTTRSSRAVRQLQARITPTATVLRDGAWREIARGALVPGDVIRLAAGDMLPADARLITASDLHVQQSALTGEPFPVEKQACDAAIAEAGPDAAALVYLGSSVVSGSATAVIFATGDDTAFGDVVAALAARPAETELERGIRAFGLMIVRTVGFLVAFVLIVNLALGRNAMESLLFSVALAVGMTPELLPVISTVTLAQGAMRMARDKVIVKHLPAIQNLGSIDVLCSDKTGTLTRGTMTLDASLDPLGAASPHPLALARRNSRFETGIASPLDAALLAGAPDDDSGCRKTDEVPFDFERRRMSVVVADGARHQLIAKGAPESVLAACTAYALDGAIRPLDDDARARCEATYRAASERGARVLAIATRDVDRPSGFRAGDERDLVLAGFVTFSDPPVDGVAASIERLRADGVAIKILTGDNELVARHVCAQVGLGEVRIVLGKELDALTDVALGRVAETATVFARVSPAQKQRIVRALKAAGHVVGYLGDGINDAPSLHDADVGISVAGAVDVAREAADIVLLERRLDVLHGGILAGRRALGNVRKYLLMGTSSNFGNMFSMAGAALLLPFLPMLPTQILLNNLLYDLAQISIPTDRVEAAYVRAPQRWDIRSIRRFMWIAGPISSAFDFLTFFVLLRGFGFTAVGFHTGWFIESLATQTLVLLVVRAAGRPWRDRPSLPLLATTLAVVAVAIALPYTPLAQPLGLAPLPACYFGFLAAIVAAYLGVVELVKARVLHRARA